MKDNSLIYRIQKYRNIQPLLIQYSEAADLDMQPFAFADNSLSTWGFVRLTIDCS